MTLKELDGYFNKFLELSEFDKADISLNGIQVGEGEQEIRKVAFAVDACLESFIRAANAGADLLFVHHGLYWGAPVRITGDFYKRIQFLMENKLALYTAHLPLDSHPEVGNNAAIANRLGLTEITPFGSYRGIKIGYKGILPEPLDLDNLLIHLGTNRDACLSVLPFGDEKVRSVGIVSGGASSDVLQALSEELDLFITGEVSHQIYHACMEGRINYIAAGHYFTEIFGVRALAGALERDTGIETLFIDVPTGL